MQTSSMLPSLPSRPFSQSRTAMKVQQLAVGGFWEQQLQDPSSPSSFSSSSSSSSTSTTSSLTVRFKLLRPLAPKLTTTVTATAVATTQTVTSLDPKDFHFPKTKCTAENPDSSRVETPSGGTRWNPAPEQIRVLEALYLGGMRTPNAHQIECITAELGKYGRIEGKNVFYWFQNHKARERQKQKRSALLALTSSNNDSRSCSSNNYSGACSPIMTLMTTSSRGGGRGGAEECYDGSCKRTCRSWGGIGLDIMEEGGSDRTLELFPLRPEGKQMR